MKGLEIRGDLQSSSMITNKQNKISHLSLYEEMIK
jgi:hypothetical protein